MQTVGEGCDVFGKPHQRLFNAADMMMIEI